MSSSSFQMKGIFPPLRPCLPSLWSNPLLTFQSDIMPIKSYPLLCLGAVFGLPLLIAGCADSMVADSMAPEAGSGVQTAAGSTVPEELGFVSTAVAEQLDVLDDGTVAHSPVNFREAIQENDGLILVDFWATWCGPCLRLAPELEKLASQHPGEITIIKVDVDKAGELAAELGVGSIPDLRVFKAGQQIDHLPGYPDADLLASKLGL